MFKASRVKLSLIFAVLFQASFALFSHAQEPHWTVRNMPRESFLVIAHRGAGDLGPENCLASLELSWSMGAGCEIDVRSTKDGRIVMFHDATFKRILPNAPEEFKQLGIKDLTYDEVRALDIGSYRGEEFKGEKVVSIEEVVAALKKDRKRRVFIDVKDVDLKQLAAAVADVRRQVTLTTNKEEQLAEWAELVPCADGSLWIGLGKAPDEELEARVKTLREKNFCGVTRVSLHVTRTASGALSPSSELIRKYADEFRRRGVELRVFARGSEACPNVKADVAFYRELLELGVMGFASDRFDGALEAVDSFYSEPTPDWNVRQNVPEDELVIMGHRGMGNEAPEGTLESFRQAWALGVDPEADIRTTKDGVVVSFHDDNFARILPDAPEEIKRLGVKDLTFAELQKLDVGAYMGEEFRGQRPVDMAAIIEELRKDPRRLIFCDLKNVDLEKFAEETEPVWKQIVLTSSDYGALKLWKELAPTSKTRLWTPRAWTDSPEAWNAGFQKIAEQKFTALDFVQTHVKLDERGSFTPSEETLRKTAAAARLAGVRFEVMTLTYGDKDFAYAKILDFGASALSGDYPTATRGAVRKYYREQK